MTDDIRIGSLAGLTVAEAARADDGVILGESDVDENERANRSLTAYTSETDP
jgi:hypothetical protein